MKALCITARPAVGELGATLQMLDVPTPQPRRQQVRVRVQNTTVNIDDIHIAEGTMYGGLPVSPKAKPTRPAILGTEFAGIVDRVGPGTSGFVVGQAVFGACNPMRGQGPWAEFCCAPAAMLHARPDYLSPRQAAALLLASSVVVEAIGAGNALQGRRALVVGASGGLGSVCVKVLVHAGVEVWGVCSAGNADTVMALGARRVLDYNDGPIDTQVTPGQFATVLDFVGGKDVERAAMRSLDKHGHFVTVVGGERFIGDRHLGLTGAIRALLYALWRMLATRLNPSSARYSLAGPRTIDFSAIDRHVLAPQLTPQIDSVVPFSVRGLRDAIDRVRSHRAVGKVVVDVSA